MNREIANKLNNIFGKMGNSNITRTFRNNQYLKRKMLKEFIKPCYNRYSYNFIYNKGIEMTELKEKIEKLAKKYSDNLNIKVQERVREMAKDNKNHYLIYRVLGISFEEGENIDLYQNKGRFLYKYAGSFLEEAAVLCFNEKFGTENAKKVKIPNSEGTKPKTFEIDCLVGEKHAYEIKWRDATTDGDHITKEHTRIKVIHNKGYIPLRLMFYYPNRTQAIKIQQTLETLYNGIGGKYYYGDSAWEHLRAVTGIDLLSILTDIADKKTGVKSK